MHASLDVLQPPPEIIQETRRTTTPHTCVSSCDVYFQSDVYGRPAAARALSRSPGSVSFSPSCGPPCRTCTTERWGRWAWSPSYTRWFLQQLVKSILKVLSWHSRVPQFRHLRSTLSSGFCYFFSDTKYQVLQHSFHRQKILSTYLKFGCSTQTAVRLHVYSFVTQGTTKNYHNTKLL